MAILVLTITILMVMSFVSPLEISHLDLEKASGTCGATSSCLSLNMTVAKDMKDRQCMCDQRCVQYGDCCVDSPFFNLVEQRRAYSSYECVPVPEHNIYMKTTCPPSWRNSDIRRKCEVCTERTISDPLLFTPLTVTKTSITYGNVFCALCHKQYDAVYWNMAIQCVGIKNGSNTDNITDKLTFKEDVHRWVVEESHMYRNCSLSARLPPSLDKSHIRECVPNITKSCAAGWTNKDILDRCEAYTTVTYRNESAFRNSHCAICNNVPVQDLSCSGVEIRFYPPPYSPFPILLDFRGGKTVGKIQPCKNNQLYDPFFKICRDLIIDDYEQTSSSSADDAHVLVDIWQLNCSKYMLNTTEYVLEENGLYVPAYKTTFYAGSYTIDRKNNSAFICVNSNIAKKFIWKYKNYFTLLTTCGIAISIISICLHLLAFCMVDELRNLNGLNLASMSASLLLAYTSFIFGNVARGKACFVNAIVTYYFFLASFFWMTTIAFDVWRALKLATSELRTNKGKQWKKFAIYSCWSWVMPANVVIVSIFVEMSPRGYISDDFRPNFGTVSCWFGQGESLLVFVGGPLSVIMLINLAFFTTSSCLIYSNQSSTVHAANADTLRNVKLYSRLALIMGLTWIIGLVAGFVDNEIVWVVFILLNTSQGLFIFIAFTWRKRVVKSLKERIQALHAPVSTMDNDISKSRRTSAKTSSTYY